MKTITVNIPAAEFDYILKDCQETESTGDPMSAMCSVDPAYGLANFLNSSSNKQVVFDLSAIKITLLQDTTHGKITSVIDNTGRSWYRYDPTSGYVDNDQATFMAEFAGKTYKIVVNLVVSLQVNENPLTDEQTPVCPPPTLTKVNGKSVSGALGSDINVSLTDREELLAIRLGGQTTPT
jgi:hypothetical protein